MGMFTKSTLYKSVFAILVSGCLIYSVILLTNNTSGDEPDISKESDTKAETPAKITEDEKPERSVEEKEESTCDNDTICEDASSENDDLLIDIVRNEELKDKLREEQ